MRTNSFKALETLPERVDINKMECLFLLFPSWGSSLHPYQIYPSFVSSQLR